MRKRLWYNPETLEVYRKDVTEVYHQVNGSLGDLTNKETLDNYQFMRENPFENRETDSFAQLVMLIERIKKLSDELIKESILNFLSTEKNKALIQNITFDEKAKTFSLELKSNGHKFNINLPNDKRTEKAMESDIDLLDYLLEMGV